MLYVAVAAGFIGSTGKLYFINCIVMGKDEILCSYLSRGAASRRRRRREKDVDKDKCQFDSKILREKSLLDASGRSQTATTSVSDFNFSIDKSSVYHSSSANSSMCSSSALSVGQTNPTSSLPGSAKTTTNDEPSQVSSAVLVKRIRRITPTQPSLDQHPDSSLVSHSAITIGSFDDDDCSSMKSNFESKRGHINVSKISRNHKQSRSQPPLTSKIHVEQSTNERPMTISSRISADKKSIFSEVKVKKLPRTSSGTHE